MKQFLLLLTLAGVSYAIQGGIHYKYKYYGSISTGIPELSSLASGWAIKADVNVYVEYDTGTAIFQLEHVLTAEFNDDIGCDSRDEIPHELFAPINDHVLSVAIEHPFTAHLFDDQEISIEYIEDGLKWLVNLRKGIVSVFKNEVLRGNVENQIPDSISSILNKGHVVEVFQVEEETLFGKCFVQYSLHRIPEHLAISKERELKKYIEADDQSKAPESSAYTTKTSRKSSKKQSKTSKKTYSKTRSKTAKIAIPPALKIDPTLWHVVRTVNFDRCNEVVGIQAKSIEGSDNIFGGQVDWRRSRSSVTEYILRGSPGHFRVEKAIVEGATTLAPFAFKTELLQGRINQTYYLVSATKLRGLPIVDPEVDVIKHSNTWMQEIWTRPGPPTYSKNHPWLHYTGEGEGLTRFEGSGMEPITDQQIANVKNAIIEKIKTVSLILTDLEQEDTDAYSGSPAEDISHAAWFFKFLPKEKISEIFELFFSKDLLQSDILAKKLVVDAAAASGYHHAIDTILDYIKQGKIPDLQIITVLSTLASNIESTTSFPNILDWILTLDIKEKPFVTTTALVNFAHMVSDMCIFPNARNVKFAGQLLGDYACYPVLKDKFMPLIKKLIDDERDWVKIVGISTLKASNANFKFQVLVPIIEGKVKCSTKVRHYAIFALTSFDFYHQKQLKEPIVDFLTGIYTDYGVNVALREAALDVVSTWGADAAFFHSIARLSWREPSKRFASFMTSLIKTWAENDYIKESSQAAAHALPFARPTIPSHEYSEYFFGTEKDLTKYTSKILGGSFFASKSLKHLTEIYTFMLYDLGGLEVIVSEGYALASDLFVAKRVVDDFAEGEEKPELNNIAARIAKDFYDRIEDTIKTKPTTRGHEFTLDLSWKLFNHIHYFLPLNKDTVSKLPYSDMTSIAELLLQLTMGYDLVLGKFFNPFDFISFQATEIGLPLMTAGSSPILLTDVSYTTLSSSSENPGLEYFKKGQMTQEVLSRASTMFQTSLSFILPWNLKFIQTGVKAKRDVVFPLKEALKGRQSNDGGHQNFLHYDFESQYKRKFSVVKASNTPYTLIIPAFPGDEGTFSFKKIVKTEPSVKHIKPFPVKYTGLELDLQTSSEVALPFTLFGEDDILNTCSDAPPLLFHALVSPTVKFWEIDLTFDPEKSTTKKISIETMFGEFGKSQPESFTQERGDFYQYGQEGFDQYDQGSEQFSQTPSFDFPEGFQEIGGFGNPEVETLAHVNYGDSLQQRSQKMQEYFGGNVKTVSLKVDLDGSEHRSYEILFSLSKSKPNDLIKLKKFQVSLIRSPIPHVDDKPASVCIDVQKSVPFITALDTFEGVLSRELKKEIKAEITLGCTGKPVFVAKSSYELSEKWKKAYIEHLQGECDYDPSNPLFTLKNHAVYDQAKVTVTWDKVCDPKRFPITSRLFDVTHNILGSGFFDYDCQDETERELKLNIYRCPINWNWFIDVTRGETVTKFENLPHDPVFNFLFGVKIPFDNIDFIPSHTTPFNLESDKCIVGVDKVRTFDGFVYEYHPTQCWTVAYKDCFKNQNMLLVRSPQGESSIPEARYIDIEKGLVVDFSRNTIKVNGKIVDPVGGPEIIKDEEEKVTLVKVYKRGDYYKLSLDDDETYIIFKDQIEILVDSTIWGHTCGLCGDSDGEPEAELIGPHRCIFSDPNLFVASWTAGSDTCDLYTLMEVREEVERYQDTNCHVVEEYEDHCKERNGPCIYYQWKIISDGADYDVCVSSAPLSYCRPECQIVSYQEKEYTYSCWPQEHTPEALKTALANNKTVISDPIVYEPYYQITYKYKTPVICKHY